MTLWLHLTGPYGAGGDDVRRLSDDNGLARITFTVPASNIWVQMWIEPDAKRIVKETIIDPGHRIDHTTPTGAAPRP